MSSYLQHPTSYARAEPVPERRPSPPRSTTTVDIPPPAGTSATYAHSDAPAYEWSAGNMSDGTISVTHPAVQRYVERAACGLEVAEAAHAAMPENALWHVTTDHHVSWWRAEMGGTLQAGMGWDACRTQVEQALDFQPGELDIVTVKAVFTLAALSLFAFPGKTAFWAFWAKNSWEVTAALVEEVINTQPPPITMPRSVTWVTRSLFMEEVAAYRRGWLPVVSRPVEKRVPRRKAAMKAKAAAAASTSRKSKPTRDDEEAEQPQPKKRKTGASGSAVAEPVSAAPAERVTADAEVDDSAPATAAQSRRGAPALGSFTIQGPAVRLGKGVFRVDTFPLRNETYAETEARFEATAALMMMEAGTFEPSSSSQATGLEAIQGVSLPRVSTSDDRAPAAMSPQSTLVGTATPVDELTRINASPEAPEDQGEIELDKVDAKLAESGKVSAR
ncbi:hypothetical protein L227DRAFT_616572 [Lentinus tigrinus ALCF2SS1-6]|uniref:Uncharacterized protein n=1 Tax=Lentinus tigrinus ALCF2SS1-6 TaxID=1328759 RepID=A0A5C2RRS4_9APHY|nr:hypothetical protein L227DRAFT_616572 [Lentinus tigrinus ALCF2SS1-6]